MKLLFFSYLVVFLFSATVLAIAPQKAVILTYPEGTPDSVMDQAKDAIRTAGGVITHEYKIIKGFAAQASAKALESIRTFSTEYLPFVEEDSIVSVDGDLIEKGHTD